MDRRQTDRRLNSNRDLYVLDIAAIFKTLLRRKYLLAAFAFMVFVPAALFVLFRPDYYVAKTSVLLEDPGVNLTDFKEALPKETLNDMTLETQVQVIDSLTLAQETLDVVAKEKNPPALALAASDEKSRYEAVRSFVNNLHAENEGKSRVIGITYKAKDPYEAARLVNAHTKQYVDYHLRNKKDKIRQINEWITEQVAVLRADTKKKTQAIQDFRKNAGIVLGKNSQDLIDQQIADLTEQLIPVETRKLDLQTRAAAKGSTSEIVDSPLITSLKTQASQAKQELQSLSATYGPSHPAVMAAKQRVQQATADLARETGTIKTSVKTELQSVTEQEELIRARLEALNKEMDALRENSLALESLEAEELANRTLEENFLARSEELKSQLNYNNSDVQIVALAETPTDPIGISRLVLLALAAVFSVAFAVGAVLLLELVDRGIEDAEDVKKILNLRLLGTLPKVRNPLAEISQNRPSRYLEDLKRIYLSLAQKKGPQSILVTASRSGEGKTTTAYALARYLTSIGTRAIIIDANTTSPSIATLAEVQGAPGLAEYLGGASDLAKVVQKDDEGVSIIASGNQSNYRIDVLSSAETLRRMIETLKGQYEYIIFDCAPVLSTTDAEIIAGQVDQVILVIEWAKAPKKQLAKVAGTLRQFAKEPPGVILNKQPV